MEGRGREEGTRRGMGNKKKKKYVYEWVKKGNRGKGRGKKGEHHLFLFFLTSSIVPLCCPELNHPHAKNSFLALGRLAIAVTARSCDSSA
jgi:hypothetical protein